MTDLKKMIDLARKYVEARDKFWKLDNAVMDTLGSGEFDIDLDLECSEALTEWSELRGEFEAESLDYFLEYDAK